MGEDENAVVYLFQRQLLESERNFIELGDMRPLTPASKTSSFLMNAAFNVFRI